MRLRDTEIYIIHCLQYAYDRKSITIIVFGWQVCLTGVKTAGFRLGVKSTEERVAVDFLSSPSCTSDNRYFLPFFLSLVWNARDWSELLKLNYKLFVAKMSLSAHSCGDRQFKNDEMLASWVRR